MLSLLLSAFLLQATYIDLYQQGHQLLDQGRYEEAERVLQDSASLNPGYAPALKDLAKTYVKLKLFPEAIDVYKRITELDRSDIGARANLAELYAWNGDHDRAIVTYQDALEIAPRDTTLMNGLARVLRWTQRYAEAERLYKEVLSANPDNHEAMKGLAKAYAMTGDLTRAADMLNKAIELYPDDPELHKELGTVLGWQENYTEAVSALERAVKLQPGYVDAFRTMGDVYTWMKSYRHAVESYEKARELEPDNVENYLLIARAYRLLGDTATAEEAVRSALRVDPSSTQAVEMLRDLRKAGKFRLAARIGDIVEGAALIFVFVLLVFTYRSKRRMLVRRHKLYFYFISLVLPALVIFALSGFVAHEMLARWIGQSMIEDITEAVLFFALGVSLLLLLWVEHRGQDYSHMTILAVGAHPDDIELGCGGFIMKAKDSGATVYGMTMTRGEKGANKTGKREAELRRASQFMELDGFWICDFPDTELKDSIGGMKDAIEEKIKEVNASVVLTHTAIDVHQDHQAVFEATKVAARNISILCYEDVSTPREFVPNYFVDVSGYIEDKLKLIGFHKTQGAKTYMDPDVIRGRAAHRGLQSGVQYAEAFRIHKLLR